MKITSKPSRDRKVNIESTAVLLGDKRIMVIESIDNESLEQKIVRYCTEEGILRRKLPENEKVEFGFNVEFPPNHPLPKTMTVLQPKDKSFIIIQIGIKISPEHLSKLEEFKLKGLFFDMLKRMLLSKNLIFKLEIEKNRFMLSEQIYEEGLNMDVFYRYLREIFNTSLTTNLLLTDIVARKGLKFTKNMDGRKNSKEKSFGNFYS